MMKRNIKKSAMAILALSILAPGGMAAGAGEPNPYAGRQERTEVFAFARKPAVSKKGSGYVITFASKAACDATVTVVNKDGKAVRHLASGVLGKNAPWPFKQNSLEQSLEWDGKDDDGKPVPAGCSVRVGLGLNPKLDRFLGWSPDAIPLKAFCGFAPGPNGQLFVLTGGHETSGMPVSSPHVYVLDRRCRYQRTILPPPATVTGDKAQFLQWAKTADGKDVPRRRMSYIMNTFTKGNEWSNVDPHGPVVTPDGRFLFLSTPRGRKSGTRWLGMLDIRDGRSPKGSVIDLQCEGKIENGPVSLAVSPDGKWLYLSGADKAHQKRFSHAVCRMSLEKPGAVEVFAGNPKTAGSDNKHFNLPAAVACDKDGNLFVADYGNNRIQVFRGDGSHLKTIPVKGPKYLAVHHKTGAIYVKSVEKNNYRLLKLGGLSDPTVKASVKAAKTMVVDVSHDPVIVWYGHTAWKQASRIKQMEERGDTFVKTSNQLGPAKGWERWRAWTHHASLAANRQRDELMMKLSESIRVDGKTGKVVEKVKGRFNRVCAGPDGRYWMQNKVLKQPKMDIYCHDPAGSSGASKIFAAWHNAQGRNFADYMGVAPNGDLYIPFGFRREHKEELLKAGFKVPPDKGKRNVFTRGASRASLLYVLSPEGKLKTMNALPGLGLSNGIRIGRRGEVYVSMACQPLGMKSPEGMAEGTKWDGKIWGTLVKFDSRYGKFPVGRVSGSWDEAKPGKVTHYYSRNGEVSFENMAWDYPGVSPQPLGGGAAGCTCWRSAFDLDKFDRSFVPSSHTCTVTVLDSNGNIILKIGAYGNADSRGKDSAVIDPENGEFRPRREGDPKDLVSPLAKPEIAFLEPSEIAVTDEALYVVDRGNERIVRVELKSHVEETLALP